MIKNQSTVESVFFFYVGFNYYYKTNVGVRQGYQFSPLLFALFINELPTFLENTEIHASWIGENEIKVLLYADDVVLLSRTKVGLQKGVIKIEEYCVRWNLKVNIRKTKIMISEKKEN